MFQGVEKSKTQKILKNLFKQKLVDNQSLKRTLQVIFSEGEPEVIDHELADLITDPACIVPFLYSMKPKMVAEFLPKAMSLPQAEGVFGFDIERLFQSSTEKKDLVLQALTLADCENLHH